jgi:hypothetical protein
MMTRVDGTLEGAGSKMEASGHGGIQCSSVPIAC